MTEHQRRWLITIVALISIGFGILSLGKPYWTLECTPVWLAIMIASLTLWRGPVLHRIVIGLLVLAIAIALVSVRDFGIVVLVYSVLAYVAFCGTQMVIGIRDRNWSRGATGVGLILFAILGAYWVDVASILIGLLIGPTLIVGSVVVLIRIWNVSRHTAKPHPVFGILARVGSIAILLLAMITSVFTFQAIQTEPVLDAFAQYDEPLPDTPSVLLRTLPFERGMPEASNATRILYTTTGHAGEIVLATGLVIVPEELPEAPLPAILWTHGTTGIDITCAPTLLDDPLGSGAMMFPDLPLEQGWAIIAPDYLGLGASAPHPYMVGAPAANSALDAVRAAWQLQSVSFNGDTVVWGHSQGGGAALWVGIQQQTYAPDVPLLGIAALAPASNLPGFIDTLMAGAAGPIFGGYILRGYANWYDDVHVEDYVRPGARFSQKMIVSRCLSEPSFIANIASVLIREPYTSANVKEGLLYDRLRQNIPSQPTGIPIFLGQGEADPLIVPAAQDAFVTELCEAGQILEYHTYTGKDHLGVVGEDSPLIPDLMRWTEARFAGDALAESCMTIEN